MGSRIPGTGFQSLSEERGFWIPIVSRTLDSLSGIPESKAQDFRFHKQNFPGFRILQTKGSQILESGFPYMERLADHLMKTTPRRSINSNTTLDILRATPSVVTAGIVVGVVIVVVGILML